MTMYQYIVEGNFEQVRQAVKTIDKMFRRYYNVYGSRTSYKRTYAVVRLEANWSMLYGYGVTYADLHKMLVNKLNRLGYTCANNIIWVE